MASLEDFATQADAQVQAAASAPLPLMHAVDPKHSLGFRLTFTQGLLVGQLSIILLAIVFIRYFIFEDVNTALEKERSALVRRSEKTLDRAARRRAKDSSTNGVSSANLTSILANVGYDITSHAAESTDWLNVLLAQAVAGYREDVLAGGAPLPGDEKDKDGKLGEKKERTARDLMQDILNRSTGKAAEFLDPIRVTEVDFGDQYPLFSNARVRPADDAGRMRIEVDVDYADHITMAIDTKLVINLPKPRFAVLPISLSLTITRFSGTLAIELFSTDPSSSVLPREQGAKRTQQEKARSRHHLHFSLHPDFALDASASSLLGSRAKLQDVPKIEQLLVGRLRAWVHERFVWPRFWSVSLPNLVPSPSDFNKNTSKNANGTVPPDEAEMHVAPGIDPRCEDGLLFEEDPTLSHYGRPINGASHAGRTHTTNLDQWRAQSSNNPTSKASSHSHGVADAELRKRFQSSAGGWGRMGAGGLENG